MDMVHDTMDVMIYFIHIPMNEHMESLNYYVKLICVRLINVNKRGLRLYGIINVV